MKGYNRVTLMGNLTRDPEVRYTTSGMACARFSLAVGYSRKKQDGSYEDAADFPVEGKIQTGSCQDKNGNKRYTTNVLVLDFNFVGGKKDGQGSGSGYRTGPEDFPIDSGAEADIPF